MPNAGDQVAYFWIPLGEVLPLDEGPYQPDIPPEQWLSGDLRPSQQGLPQPTLDISLLLRRSWVSRDDGIQGIGEIAATVRAHWLSRARFLDWLRRSRVRRALRRTAGVRRPATVVEAAVTLPPGVSPETSDFDMHLTSALDSAISLTRQLALTASVESHQPRLLPALELLPSFIPYFVVESQGGGRVHAPRAPLGLLGNAAHLVWDEGSAQLEAPALLGIPSIYGPYQGLRNDAEVALAHHGQYRASLILAAAAAEVLMHTLMRSVLLEAGEDPAAARIVMDARDGVLAKAEKVLGPRLRGVWDRRSGSVTALWKKTLVDPRNAAVHRGASVTREEAQQACGALNDLRRWVGGLVFANRKKYPKTALAMSLGVMMTPEGTENTQFEWVAKRLEEVGEDYVGFLLALDSWPYESET